MKRIFKKSNIFSFLLGALIFTGITSVAAYTILAKDIEYTPSDSTWKKSNGEDITNVKDAIDELYTKTSEKSEASVLFKQTYIGDGVSFSYTLDNDYKEVYIQGDCRAADPDIYLNVSSPNITFTKEYDTGIGVVMDKSYDRTYVYHGSNLSKNTVINFAGRFKGTVVIYGIK